MFNLPFRAWNLPGASVAQRVALVAFFGQLYFFVPVMTPYLEGKGLSLAQIAGMQTFLMIGMLVMEVPTGVLADRMGHRRSYQLCMVMAALGEVFTLTANTYPKFLFAQFVAGTGYAFGSGSMDAYVYESLPADDRTVAMQRARGFIGASIQASSLFAYSVGAWITHELTYARMRLLLKMDVVGVGTAAVLAFLILREPAREIATERLNSRELFRTGWRSLRSNRHLQRLMLIAIATNAFGAHLLIFYQAYFLNAGVAPVWLGLGLSLASGIALFAQLHSWRLSTWLGNRRALMLATGLPGLLYLAMGASSHQPVLAVILFIAQWSATQLVGPLLSGLYNAHIPENARATTLSLINGIVTIYTGVGGVVLGWLGGRSIAMTFAILGVIVLAATLLIRLPADEDAVTLEA